MAHGKVIVRLSSSVAEEATSYLTECEVQRLVGYVATHADAGIHSEEISNLPLLSG
jgi:hypothetical protein